jgi:ATP-dependent RNA helicase DeaD
VTQDFAEAGLSQPLAEAVSAAGYEWLTPLQAAAFPVLRRGGNVVLHASSGAGVTAAFGLPLLDRLREHAAASGGAGDGPAALVLAATPEQAAAVAAALTTLGGAGGPAVRTTAPGWRLAGADLVVTTPDGALREVRSSALKLEAVQAVVILDLADQLELTAMESLTTLFALLPRDAQRVVASAQLDGEPERFIEAHVRRPLTVPARPADPEAARPREAVGQIGYVVLGEIEKPDMLARLLEGVEGDVLVRARTAARAERVLGELARRGIGPPEHGRIRVVGFGTDAESVDRTVSYDVPFSADELRRFHEGGGTVFVTPAELPHFRRIAEEVPFTTKQRRARTFDATGLDAYRATIAAALQAEDLSAQLLVLEPLFETASAAEVAAALSALLRRRTPAEPAVAAAPPESPAGPAPKDAGTGSLTRLFLSIGARDNIRPGDLVGAITGEAGIKGDQVGRVDIRDSFSVVEVAASAADRVIRALNGTTMRGRSLRVDYDRKSGGETGARPGPRSGGPPRGAGGPRSTGGPPRRRPPQR